MHGGGRNEQCGVVDLGGRQDYEFDEQNSV